MTIEIKDLVEQAVTLAAERRQQMLSEQETTTNKGGGARHNPYTTFGGIWDGFGSVLFPR
ncbi:hypothetical protein D0962_31795 [Leptolyngbyaceae cyanobacterium CCMR0082]|uniref:Uncharacterized protein n=1 Tax=Adonisia turfae CCMR0082 TaxID=2304604 RepID=A0A6M0SFL2_9CYAN|nr:hypothetical protein [Adonisia turfae]MDV3348619.1 hypothetical protein [Leptothoe sp. LEGE 181152]NEZ67288.1 hypothetical protein [Adonisia turfae CCMR0082]